MPKANAELSALRAAKLDLERRVAALETALGERSATVADLAESRARELHLKQVLFGIRNVNQLIVQEDDPQRLIERACVNLTETLGCFSAWIGVLSTDGTRVTATAYAGLDAHFDALRESLTRGEFPACVRQVLGHERAIVVTDPPRDCPACPLAAGYADRAGLACRLAFGARLFGVLVVAVPARFARDPEERALFEEVAGDLAFALQKIEREARASLLAEMLDSAPSAITVHDFEGRFLYANRKCFALHGYTEPEFMALTLRDLDVPDSAAQAAARMARVQAEGEASFEVAHYRKDGTTFPMELFVKRVEWRGVPAMISIGTDIRERLQQQREKARLEEQLALAQRLESVGRLAGGVAHDFNNLLMGILSYVELCRDGLDPAHPVRSYLDEITQESQRSAGLIRQLLAFAREQPITPKLLDLNDAVSGMLKMLRRLLGEDIDLAWLPGGGALTVKMDPSQIDQILANLTVNARDAISGVGRLTIETRAVTLGVTDCAGLPEAVPGAYVVLTVSDTGCGMDEATQARAFEPFFTTKGTGGGTGLGLATVYGIVRQNGGFVGVWSQSGQGTTFRLYLPLQTSETPSPAPSPSAATRPGGRETVLLVEDEKSVRFTTRLFLEGLGYSVLAAAAPADALRLATAHPGPIHLLITDVILPELSGRDLARQLAERRPETRPLFMSGYTADVIANRGVLEPGVAFLAKPFTRDELACKVREVLDRKEARSAS